MPGSEYCSHPDGPSKCSKTNKFPGDCPGEEAEGVNYERTDEKENAG